MTYLFYSGTIYKYLPLTDMFDTVKDYTPLRLLWLVSWFLWSNEKDPFI